ncbi:MAG TPA: hypothetical protein VLZ05_22540 [Mycobacterium sp.]|nr:hypothetical protein [Mycobacterium sp.]HUH71415.1 hypothetical protein [Mycobacterium sp.]
MATNTVSQRYREMRGREFGFAFACNITALVVQRRADGPTADAARHAT